MNSKALLNIIPWSKVCTVALGFATVLGGIRLCSGESNPNPGVAPRQSLAYGKNYEEWIAAYRQWQTGIPAERNPALDETGEFCGEEQGGPVWFLAGQLCPCTVVRECHVPAGKALYVPVVGVLAWITGEADREFFSFVAETFIGLDPATLSDADLIRVFANWFIDSTTYLSLTVDGVAYQDLFSYRAESDVFEMVDTALYDDLGNPYGHPNLTITDGVSVILNPLPSGLHTIEYQAVIENPLVGQAVFDVTYHLWVGP